MGGGTAGSCTGGGTSRVIDPLVLVGCSVAGRMPSARVAASKPTATNAMSRARRDRDDGDRDDGDRDDGKLMPDRC
jgi:hypothetical protein